MLPICSSLLQSKNLALPHLAHMTSVLHAAKLHAKGKGKGKRKADDIDVDDDDVQVVQPKQKRNKQRVLLLSSRGITHRMRHLMNDLEALLPHVKKGKVVALSTNSLVLNAIYPRFKTGFKVPAASPP